jgi:hypothetical protein
MFGKATAHNPLDRSVWISEPESAGQVHVGLRREPLIEQAKRRVIFGAHETIDDAARVIVANRHRETRALENLAYGLLGLWIGVRKPNEFDQTRWRVRPVPVT